MSQFSCGAHNYRAGVIDARQQFHIVRRLAPFLGGLAPVMGKVSAVKAAGGKASDMTQDDMMDVLPKIGEALASMDDETADYVIFGLLAVVTREQGQGLGWAPVSSGKALMFTDITMPQMITLCGRALQANLGDFFAVLSSVSSQLGQKASGQ
ncbi:hypothetical protein D3C76_163570 [compost metagenome]